MTVTHSRRVPRHQRRIMEDLDLLADLAEVLRRTYPLAVEASEDLGGGATAEPLPVRTSGISDPTARAALDGRRQRRIEHVKKARKEIGHAARSLRRAAVHAGLAGEG